MKETDVSEANLRLMRELIAYTMENALAYQTFTGAFVVKDNMVVWRDITSIIKDNDPLAHAEMKALRGALSIMNGDLTGCHLYTTQRPCPMCASAIIWCGIDTIYYGLATNHQWKYETEIHDFYENLNGRCFGPVLEDECRKIDELLTAHGL